MAVSTAESVRAFIAIALEPGLVAELKKVQQELQASLPDDSVRWTRPEQLHLTLKFFGHVAAQRLNDLTSALNRACRRGETSVKTPPATVAAGLGSRST